MSGFKSLAGKKITVGRIGVEGKHYLEIEATVEFLENGFPKDTVFVAFYREFKRDNASRISMQLRNQDLIALSVAIEGTGSGAEMGFSKRTAGGSELTVGISDGAVPATGYINIAKGGEKLSVGLALPWFLAFGKRLSRLGEELDRALWESQKKISLRQIKAKQEVR
jgi:hypothetical protein